MTKELKTYLSIINQNIEELEQYFGVDDKILWTTTQEDIPALRVQIIAIKKILKEQSLF